MGNNLIPESSPQSTHGIEPMFDSSPEIQEAPYLIEAFPAIGGWGRKAEPAGVAPCCCRGEGCSLELRWLWVAAAFFSGNLLPSDARTQTERETRETRERDEGKPLSPPLLLSAQTPPPLPRWARGRYALRNPPAPFLSVTNRSGNPYRVALFIKRVVTWGAARVRTRTRNPAPKNQNGSIKLDPNGSNCGSSDKNLNFYLFIY
jgi:hypothetical protein